MQGLLAPPESSQICIGDVVYVLGFDFAEVIGIGCCIHRRRRGGGKVHIQYANGQFYHVQRRWLRLVQARSDAGYTPQSFQCPLCQERCFVIGSSCGHVACRYCWSRWANAQLDPCQHNATLRCVGHQCEMELSGRFLELLQMVFSGTQHWHASFPELRGMQVLLRRHRLQRNPLFPPAMQVNCRQPGCYGLGYLGFDTVMCFFCEDQWRPGEAISDSTGSQEHISGTKRCPQCSIFIEKNGGCDHMTCVCGHEFWWSTLQPYRR